MIISAKVLINPRTKRLCYSCGVKMDGPQLQLFGAPDIGDKPYNTWYHTNCYESRHELSGKVRAAIEAYKKTPAGNPGSQDEFVYSITDKSTGKVYHGKAKVEFYIEFTDKGYMGTWSTPKKTSARLGPFATTGDTDKALRADWEKHKTP